MRQPQSQPSLYGRSCVVCSHADLLHIDSGLVAHLPIAQLARQFGVSRDSLYRHTRYHLAPVVQQAVTSTPSTRPLALVERLARIADDARDAAATAYASGNAQMGARLAEAERRALTDLADRFHIDHDSVTADRVRTAQIARALDAALEASPELATLVADALDAGGLTDIATGLRADTNPEMRGIAT